MTDALPKAVWEGSFTMFGVPLRCYVLDDGRRIIDADDLRRMYEADRGGVECDEIQQRRFVAWLTGKGA